MQLFHIPFQQVLIHGHLMDLLKMEPMFMQHIKQIQEELQDLYYQHRHPTIFHLNHSKILQQVFL
jgi:hypothetical protein